MRHSIKSTMFVGAFLFGLLMCFTSCEDILGHWEKPTPVTPTPTPTPEPEPEPTPTPGLLAGTFKINADGDQVQFSQGNLQATYDGTKWTWAFATNQWDYIGNDAGNTSVNGDGTVSAAGTVDLFGWVGESNTTWTGAAKYGISNSNTTGDANTYGNVAAEALRSDWGNTMDADWSNKTGASTSGWRTLTGGSGGEWEYLFNTRTTTSGIRYAKATVNGKVGVILLPDDWDVSYYALTSANTPNAAYTTNAITSDDWTNKLEAHGAVFLPAAGRRDDTTVSYVGTAGCYWSSSPYTTSVHLAYCVYFTGGSLKPADYINRFYGFSVRLVRDAE